MSKSFSEGLYLLQITAGGEWRSAQASYRVIYEMRYWIELILEVWKSQAKLDRVAGLRRERVSCELYAKLIGVVITHLLSAPLRWVERELSLTKAYQVLQRLAIRLAQSLSDRSGLEQMLTLLQERWLKFALKDRRKGRLSTLEALCQLANHFP